MTPHRDFRDDDDRLWNAWDVIPTWGERRTGERRHSAQGAPFHSGEKRRAERRVLHGIRIALPEALAHGWLAFESANARRRLVPIPPEWEFLPDANLRDLWRTAQHLPPRRRLIE